MKISDYITPLLKWWWLIFLSTAVAAGASFFVIRAQPPIYMSRTTLLVGSAISDPNPSATELSLSRQLAEAYASTANREPIQTATMEALGLEFLPDYEARAVPNSPWVEISVTDTDPRRAQIVADELANQLVQQSPSNLEKQDNERVQFVNQQLDDLQEEIVTTQKEIDEKYQFLASLSSASQIDDTLSDIQALEQKLNLLQTNYGTLLASTQQGAVNIISIFEPANLPGSPVGPNKPLIILLASASGFILAAGVAYLIEFFDRSLKSADQISRLFNIPVIGVISQIAKNSWAFVAKNPRSPVAEGFRGLRVNLEFISVDEPLKTVLISSVQPEDGKSTIASNLAFSLAQSEEKKVLLLDCDLRKSKMHQSLGISRPPGLTDVLNHSMEIKEVIFHDKEKNLDIILPGTPPPNPAEILGTKRMKTILNELCQTYDIIIIDGPPMLVTDTLTLAPFVSGVLIVIRYGRTLEGEVKAVVTQLDQIGAKLLGVVLNNVPSQSTDARRYYSSDYYISKEKA